MAQVNLDVVYNVKGMQALKQSQTAMDQASKAAGTGANNIQKFNRATAATGPAAAKGAVGIKAFGTASKYASTGVKALGASIAASLGPIAAATAIIGAFGQGLKTIVDVDFSAAKLRTLGVDAEKLGTELRGVTKELEGQASQAELMGAAYDVASAGFTKASDAADVLTAASKGAVGGFTDINTVANATTSVLNAYGKSAADAERLVDQFIQTQNDGKIVIAEYAANISKVAPVAAALGIELGEVNAIISQVTATGTKAEVAFTGLKTALAQLASGNANKALADIGVQISAADIKSQGLIGVLQKIKDSGVDVGLAFKAFGNEAAPVLQAVFNDLEKTNQLLDNQKNSAGAAAAAQTQAANTIQGAWKRVQTAFSNLFADQSAFGSVIKVALQGLAAVITEIGNRLNLILQPFKIFLQTVGLIVGKIQELGQAFQQGLQSSASWEKLTKVFEVLQAWIGKAGAKIQELLAPAFEAALGWATQFGEYVGTTLFNVIDGLIQNLVRITSIIPGLKGLSEEMDAAWQGLKETVSQVNKELEETGENGTRLAAMTAELANLQQQAASFQATQNAALNNANTLAQARLTAEGQLLGVKKQQAEQELASAQTLDQKLAAIDKIHEITVSQAEIEYEQTKLNLEVNLRKLEVQRDYLALKVKEAQVAFGLAQQAGEEAEAAQRAVVAAQEGLALANEQLATQKAANAELEQAAAAIRDQKIEAAGVVREQQRQEAQQHATNAAIGQGVQQMNALAAAASAAADQVARATGGGGGGKSTTQTGEYKNFIPASAISGSNIGSRSFREDLASGFAKINHPRFGQVTYDQYKYLADNPTHGLKHYKADQEAQREEQKKIQYEISHGPGSYEASQRSAPGRSLGGGGSAPAVNVNYSGSTLSFNGDDYVSKGDVNGIVGQAVGQTMKTLSSSSGARLRAGLR